MLYINEQLPISSRTFNDKVTGIPFTVNQVNLGTPGPGEQLIVLTVPKTVKELKAGMNPDISIGYTESFRPRIHEVKNDDVYLLITSKGTNKVGENSIQVPKHMKEDLHVLRRGFGWQNSHDGSKHWQTALFRFIGNTGKGVIRIHTDDSTEDEILVVAGGKVTHCSEQTLKNVCHFKKVPLPGEITWVKI